MAENWLERTERILVQMHWTSDESLEFVTALLHDEAYQWWVSVTKIAPPESITWKFFLDEFKKHYVGRIYLANMRREFHNLRQRQMSVTEYQREFTQFSKYAPEILVSEEERCHRFEDGLNNHIRAHVTGFFHNDFSKIVTCALNAERVKKEEKYEKIVAIVSQIVNGKEIEFTVNEDGILYYKDQVCVPNDNDLRKAILEEAYSGSFTIHPGSTKMYQDLKMSFWWFGMKRDVSEFVTKCLVCQRVKAEHQVPSGLL